MTDSVLHVIERGDLAGLSALLAGGLDPARPVDPDGDLALCWAAAYGRVEMVELLAAHGAPLDATPVHGMGGPALSDALFAGQTATAQRLAELGATVDFASAAALGRLEEVGAVEETDDQRWGAFLLACKNGQLDVVRHLVRRGLDLTVYPPGDEWGGIGASGLHWAVAGGHTELARYLVLAGTPVDIVDDVYANTPLGWALLDGDDQMVALLESLGARRDLAVS